MSPAAAQAIAAAASTAGRNTGDADEADADDEPPVNRSSLLRFLSSVKN